MLAKMVWQSQPEVKLFLPIRPEPSRNYLTVWWFRPLLTSISRTSETSSSGQPVYITKRFDVVNGVKESSQEDFATVLQMTEEGSDSNFKYHGNYAQIADAIRQFVPAWMPQMEQFFRMVVFDYLFANEDAHVKKYEHNPSYLPSLTEAMNEYLQFSTSFLQQHMSKETYPVHIELQSKDMKGDVYITGNHHQCRTRQSHYTRRKAY